MSKSGRGRGPVGRDVQISKAMSLLLRHAADKEGVHIDAQGYANVADVVSFLRREGSKLSVVRFGC